MSLTNGRPEYEKGVEFAKNITSAIFSKRIDGSDFLWVAHIYNVELNNARLECSLIFAKTQMATPALCMRNNPAKYGFFVNYRCLVENSFFLLLTHGGLAQEHK
jgi:hypothetical protein